ncbi:DUF2262 domain-containing protein [Rubrivirga marina]|uniref:DUF2262 domain-containing protein n=1 Tax=Rubrivirga marina TaxID=1196024 RepID=A0A271IYV7_9BACT|nr:DUF2262 domain-containing protein [Rubrivirga marina]PAP76436.1 hypothetical protein BSZ37_08275 [Rubrivirga marina]
MTYAPIDHPRLGRLEYDDYRHWYAGRLGVAEPPATLYVSCDDDGPNLDAADRVVAALDRLREEAEARAVADLLDDKNGNWLGDDDADETAESFRAKMRLQSVVIEPDGGASFSFDDGDLFWGHTIMVYRAPDGTWDEADIAG